MNHWNLCEAGWTCQIRIPNCSISLSTSIPQNCCPSVPPLSSPPTSSSASSHSASLIAHLIVPSPNSLLCLASNCTIMLWRIRQQVIQYTAICKSSSVLILSQSSCNDWKRPFRAANACSTCTHIFQFWENAIAPHGPKHFRHTLDK